MTTFNLIDEDWIPVLEISGGQRLVSIRECLRNADHFVTIAGELPTISIAIQRLLQAILLRVAGDLPATNEARARLWGEWWEAGGLPWHWIDSYLTKWHRFFDLFDEEVPFFQVPGIALASGGGSGLAKLIADVPAGLKFFVARSGAARERLAFEEAAQWLVHAQAFDCAGIKSGVIGDARVKGGKSYSFGYPAWAGNLMIVSIEGDNLAETLLLNLVLSATGPADQPVWETAPQRIPSDGDYPNPTGAAQVWAWPSRMIRLIERGGYVVDVILSNGEKLGPQNQFAIEPMTSWRYSKPQSAKLGRDVFMPFLHEPSHAAWRGLSGILAVNPDEQSTAVRASAGLEWLAQVKEEGVLPNNTPTRLRCVAMAYGSQASTYERDFDDIVPAAIDVLTTPSLRRVAVSAPAVAHAAVLELRDFGRNVSLASGDIGDELFKKIQSLDEKAYDKLRPKFDDWIVTLKPGTSSEELAASWAREVGSVVVSVASEYASAAPVTAAVGRLIKLNGRDIHMNTGLAEVWLRARLRKILPMLQLGATEGVDNHGNIN